MQIGPLSLKAGHHQSHGLGQEELRCQLQEAPLAVTEPLKHHKERPRWE